MLRETSKNVVIIGGGQAGAQTALALRNGGFDGEITILAAEPHAPYERPPLSKALLLDPDSPLPHVADPAEYERLGIRLCRGVTATAIDRQARTVALHDGTCLAYDWLVIATGSRLRPVDIAGYPEANVLYLRTLDDSREIARRLSDRPPVVLVGGGFIGLEVAAALKSRGCAVTVIEKAPRLLPRIQCPEVSAMVLDHHRRAGIDIRLGTGVVSGGDGHLLLDDGSKLMAGFVIAGVGIIPETGLAAAAGLTVDDGIVVDERCRTSDPHIFAAGDATRGFHRVLGTHVRLESWQNANVQAQAVACAITGTQPPKPEAPWAWSDQGALNLQIAGMPASIERVVVRSDPDQPGALTALQVCEGRVVGGCTINSPKDMTVIRRLLAEGGIPGLPADQLSDTQTPLRRFLPGRNNS